MNTFTSSPPTTDPSDIHKKKLIALIAVAFIGSIFFLVLVFTLFRPSNNEIQSNQRLDTPSQTIDIPTPIQDYQEFSNQVLRIQYPHDWKTQNFPFTGGETVEFTPFSANYPSLTVDVYNSVAESPTKQQLFTQLGFQKTSGMLGEYPATILTGQFTDPQFAHKETQYYIEKGNRLFVIKAKYISTTQNTQLQDVLQTLNLY